MKNIKIVVLFLNSQEKTNLSYITTCSGFLISSSTIYFTVISASLQLPGLLASPFSRSTYSALQPAPHLPQGSLLRASGRPCQFSGNGCGTEAGAQLFTVFGSSDTAIFHTDPKAQHYLVRVYDWAVPLCRDHSGNV